MIHYVLGFAFTPSFDKVVLIRKNKPAQLKDKLNGVGGKVEPNETLFTAMSREFLEEAGVGIFNSEWNYIADLRGSDHVIHVFYTVIGEDVFEMVRTMEVEPIVKFDLNCNLQTVPGLAPNIRWLIPYAIDCAREMKWMVVHYDRITASS